MAKAKKAAVKKDITNEEKLKALYELQLVDSATDKIRTLRGELPLEVQDLEDEIAGLETRVTNLKADQTVLEDQVSKKKNDIVGAEGLIKKYEEQQKNVRNNREFESLSKEIEYQTLEIELCNKRIREFSVKMETKKETVEKSVTILDERKQDLEAKKGELNAIVKETKKEEDAYIKKSEKIQSLIEERLLTAYQRVRTNARNGLAVVAVERDACGGCFNKIPPQRQLDIKSRKKVIVCEYCGRILVDNEIIEEKVEKVEKEEKVEKVSKAKKVIKAKKAVKAKK